LPWKIGDKVNDPLKMYLSDIFTVTTNLAGIPGLSVPIGFEAGLPVGMQILGPKFSEKLLFQFGNYYERRNK
jgi:aspartyl-tRNA(Asn)/glutamyl-tRNA(Gln) amidotransferase subunit A